MIDNFELPLAKPEKQGTLDSGKVYFLTIRNDVAHLTVIKTEAALFAKRLGIQGL